MLNFLKEEGVNPGFIEELAGYRASCSDDDKLNTRLLTPRYFYYGTDIWNKALAALLSGENLLLTGPKATGKNVLAENLAAAFGRPCWNISLSISTDAPSLIGADTFRNGEVTYQEGPVCLCARNGGFGVLDEINMAKNEALAVLHAALDHRRVIDVPGYERIELHPMTRFIATMNYGYAGTRELNEALASRFVVIDMPPIDAENLKKLLQKEFPHLKPAWAGQFAVLFEELQEKCGSAEISARALDLRGLLSAIRLTEKGLNARDALSLGISNKVFDIYERGLVTDLIEARIPKNLGKEEIYE